jgi:hypothetical protein
MKLKALAVLAAIVGMGTLAHADNVVVTTNTASVISGTSSRRHLYIYNWGPGIVYIATTSTEAVSSKGYILKSSDTLTMQEFAGTLYGVASETSALRVIKQTR